MPPSPAHRPAPAAADPVSREELRAIEDACRTLVAISAQSIAAVEELADPTQLRALVVVASRRSVSLGELADAMRMHLSTASRLCDRLVSAGLLDRADDPANRRQLILTVTDAGRRLVQTVMRRRRAVLTPMLERMPKARRDLLVGLLREFAAADGEPTEADLWFMGWTT